MGIFRKDGTYVARTLISPRERRSKPVKLSMAFSTMVVAVAAVFTLAPFVWMVLTSLRPAEELFRFPAAFWPEAWDFSTYAQALARIPFGRYLFNSLVVCAAAVVLQLLLSAAAAYAIARLKPRGSRWILLAIVSTLMIPFESLVIPLYLQMRSFPIGGEGGVNFLNTYWALILPAVVSAFNVFVLKGFFDRLPKDFIEAARIDGCSESAIFFQFVLPLSRPILSVLGIFGFITLWNSFFWPLVALNEPEMYTLMLGIQKLMETGEPWNVVMAAVTLTTVPTIMLFLILQRWIIKGIAFSGLQG